MNDTTVPYVITVLTQHYSITGSLFLHEKRLSDFLNDRNDSTVMLRNTSVARLEEPTKVLNTATFSVVAKNSIEIAFELPQKVMPTGRFHIRYPKQRYTVYMVMDGLEIRGELNLQGPLDMRLVFADTGESFVPITSATVAIRDNPVLIFKRDAVLVNVRHISYIGEVPLEEKPEEKPQNQ